MSVGVYVESTNRGEIILWLFSCDGQDLKLCSILCGSKVIVRDKTR